MNFRQQNNTRSLLAYVADADVLYKIRWMFVVFFRFGGIGAHALSTSTTARPVYIK